MAFLDAAKERRRNFNVQNILVAKNTTHLFFLPGHEVLFNTIIRDNMVFFTKKTIQCYKNVIAKDTKFNLSEMRWEKESQWVYAVILTELHVDVENHFFSLRDQYEKNTGFSFEIE